MLSPEEKQLIASLSAVVQELQAMDEGDGMTEVAPESPVDEGMPVDEYEAGYRIRKEEDMDEDPRMETAPETEEEVMKEGPDEVANNPAETRIEDDEADKVDAAVMKALARVLSVKKSAPVRQKSMNEELVSVMKSLVTEVKNQKLVVNDILEGIGVSRQVEKSIGNNPRRPYAQSASSQNATLDLIAKSLTQLQNPDSVKKADSGDVRKSLGDVLPTLFHQ